MTEGGRENSECEIQKSEYRIQNTEYRSQKSEVSREIKNRELRTVNGEPPNPKLLHPRSMLNFPGPTKRKTIKMLSISSGLE